MGTGTGVGATVGGGSGVGGSAVGVGVTDGEAEPPQARAARVRMAMGVSRRRMGSPHGGMALVDDSMGERADASFLPSPPGPLSHRERGRKHSGISIVCLTV